MSLLSLVAEYADLGDHRTGTPVDAATLDWFAACAESLGAAVQHQAWAFERYDASWSVTVDGAAVEAIPLYYEAIGDVRGTAVLQRADVSVPGPLVGFAPAGHERVALATDGRDGRLVAINRPPVIGSGVPTVCVPGDVLGGRVDVELSARLVPGASGNVVAELGDGPRRVLVSTPLSGWFACAGERGSGIAVALDVTRRLADRGVAVTLVGTSGHELEGIGVQRYLSQGVPAVDAVLHVGASVAVQRPAGSGDRLHVRTSQATDAFDDVDCVLTVVTEPSDPRAWLGEAQEWCRTGRPLLSLAGTFPQFHTAADLAADVTSQALLATMSDRVLDGAWSLLSGHR